MLWTTSGAIGVIERCVSRMLGGKRHHIVTGRLRNMGLGAMVAAAVILATIATSALNDLSDALSLRGSASRPACCSSWPRWAPSLVFATIYRYAPRAHLRLAQLRCWARCRRGSGCRSSRAVVERLRPAPPPGLQAVRLFLVLAVVLLGLSIMAMLVLVGAGIAASAERRARAAARRTRPQRSRRGRRGLTDPERAAARAPS